MRFIIAFIFLFPCVCYSQNSKDSLFFTKIETKNILRSTEISTQINIPFNSLIVNDVRADSTSIGFFKLRSSGTKKLNFPNGLIREIYSFTKDDYLFNNNPDSSQLCVFIKNFRVSNFTSYEADTKENNITGWQAGLILGAELFLYSKGSYHALYKIDTIFALKTNVENLYTIPSEIFHIIFYKLEGKSYQDIHIGKKEFSYQQINNHINEVFDDAVLNESILNKGVYKTFTEFKNNNPSIKDFEIKQGKFSDELYVSDNKQTYPLQSFWGYCDGKNLFIRSANNLFQLYRTGKTYNTLAFKSIKKNKPMSVGAQAAINMALTGIPSFSMNENAGYRASTSVFQLDMQTGEIY